MECLFVTPKRSLISVMPGGISHGADGCGRGIAPHDKPRGDHPSHRCTRVGVVGEFRVIHPLLDLKTDWNLAADLRNGFVNIGWHKLAT
jgi:hypothetical protein